MENRTEFDLSQAIRNWRQQLGQSPTYCAEDLAELESHLCDSVAALTNTGLTKEEAFLIATRRLGSTCVLEPEFAKVNNKQIWLNRLLWMLVGVQAWWVITSLAGAFSRIGSQLLILNLPASGGDLGAIGNSLFGTSVPALPTALFIITHLAAIAVLMALTAGCGRLIQRNRRTSALFRSRGTIAVAGIVICLIIFSGAVINQLSSAWMVATVGPQTYGRIAISMSIANMTLFVLQTITLAVLTVLLARYLSRRAWNSSFHGLEPHHLNL